MGETETPNVHDFTIFGRVHDSPNQLRLIFGDTRIRQIMQKNPKPLAGNIILIKLKVLEIRILDFLEKAGADKSLENL